MTKKGNNNTHENHSNNGNPFAKAINLGNNGAPEDKNQRGSADRILIRRLEVKGGRLCERRAEILLDEDSHRKDRLFFPNRPQ